MSDLRDLIALEPWNRFTAALVLGMLLARGLDFLSTWIVTPKLQLEANPLMRSTGWGRMALLNIPLLALPLLHHGISITFIVTSLLAAGSNLTAGALSRGAGEARQLEQQRDAIRHIGLGRALFMNTFGALVVCLGGAVLMGLALPPESPAWWGGLGVVMFGASGLFHFNIAILRLHRGAERNGKQKN